MPQGDKNKNQATLDKILKGAKAAEKNAKKAAKEEEKRQDKELLEQRKAEGKARRAQEKADRKNLLYMQPPKMPGLLARMLRTPSARRFNQYSEMLGMKPPSVLGGIVKGIAFSVLNIFGSVLGFKLRDRTNERFMREFRARGNEFRQVNLRERAERQYRQHRENQTTPPQPKLQARQSMPKRLVSEFQSRQMQMMQRQFQTMAKQIAEQRQQIESFTRQAQKPVEKNAVEADEKTLSSSFKQAEQGTAQKNEEDLRQKMVNTFGKENVSEQAERNISRLFEEKKPPEAEAPKAEVKKEEPKPDMASKGTDAQINKVETRDNFKSAPNSPDRFPGGMEKKSEADKVIDQTRNNLQNQYQNAQTGASEFMKQVMDKFGKENVTPDIQRNINKLYNDNAAAHDNLNKVLGKNGATAQISQMDVSNMLAFNQLSERVKNGDKSILGDMKQSLAAENMQKIMSGTDEAKYFSGRPMNPSSLNRAFNNPDQMKKMATSTAKQIDEGFRQLGKQGQLGKQTNKPSLQNSNVLEGATLIGKYNYRPKGSLQIMARPGVDQKKADEERVRFCKNALNARHGHSLGHNGLNRNANNMRQQQKSSVTGP